MLLYRLLIFLLVPLAIGRLLVRSIREPAYRTHLHERFGRVQPAQPHDLWLHAVSAGETIASEPLVRQLLARGLTIFITVSTPAGRDAATRLFGDRVSIAYSPYDTWYCVTKFLDQVSPRVALFMETEIWPGWLESLEQRGVSAALINGRLSNKSFQRYLRVHSLMSSALAKFVLIGCQSEAHRERFLSLGAQETQIRVLGSIKFDASIPDELEAWVQEKQSNLGPAPIFLAASTHPGEEEQCLAAFELLRQSFESLRLVLAPRHVTRAEDIFAAAQAKGWTTRLTSTASLDHETDVFVLDEMGQLRHWYGLASFCFVGGTLVSHGGHNFMEAALVNCPILVGPSLYNFESMAETFLNEHAMIQVFDGRSLAEAAARLLQEPSLMAGLKEKAYAIVKREAGALDKTIGALEDQGLLKPTERD